ncbi:MAG: isochorismatase family cysteine hydrolase [Alphaproteobacteria bacterium]|nr:isochorismatase family cysteine hydrolase [Alphaproteobacteria bacterium]
MSDPCLLIVDVQKGFLTEATRHIPALVEALQETYRLVLASRFLNPEGSMHRKLIHWARFAPGTEETELAFAPRPDTRMIEKTRYSCVTDDLLAALEYDDVSAVHLCGIATDGCVLKTAVDLFEAGVTPVVLADYCGSHGGPECHAAGLLLLRRFIGADQVVEGLPAP